MFSLTCAMEEGCLSSSANMAQAQSSQYGRASFGSTSFSGYGASVGLYGGKVIGHYKKKTNNGGSPILIRCTFVSIHGDILCFTTHV